MTYFYKWLLKHICKKIVVQGPNHEGNVVQYYQIMRDALEVEFTEDNMSTMDGFTTDFFNKTLKSKL